MVLRFCETVEQFLGNKNMSDLPSLLSNLACSGGRLFEFVGLDQVLGLQQSVVDILQLLL